MYEAFSVVVLEKGISQYRKNSASILLFETDEVVEDVFEGRQFLGHLFAIVEHRLLGLSVAVAPTIIYYLGAIFVRMDKYQVLGCSRLDGFKVLWNASLIIKQEDIVLPYDALQIFDFL